MDKDQKEISCGDSARKKKVLKRNKLYLLGIISAIFFALFLVMGCTPNSNGNNNGNNGNNGDNGDDPPGFVVDVAWSETSDCGSCHIAQGKSMEDKNYGSYAHFDAGETCFSCHTNAGSVLVKVHEKYSTAKVPTQLVQTKNSVNEALCLTSGCHAKADLKEKTKSSTVLTDHSGRRENPHDLPSHTDHNNMINCLSCHIMHKPLQLEVTAKYVCIGCHHDNEFECFTCHEGADGP